MSEVKQCTKCKEVKSLEDFHKDLRNQDKKTFACKHCRRKQSNKYSVENREEINSRKRDDYKNNPEKKRKSSREHYKSNKEYYKNYYEENQSTLQEYGRKYYVENQEFCKHRSTQYKKDNPHVCNAHGAKRRACKKSATPPWISKAQLEEMKDIYKQAKELEAIFFNRKFHIDHIIPLKHPDVCGLHIPWNLQILTAEENLKKHNKI